MPHTADSVRVGEGYAHDLTPWSSQVTAETQALAGLVRMMREELNAISKYALGKCFLLVWINFLQVCPTRHALNGTCGTPYQA